MKAPDFPCECRLSEAHPVPESLTGLPVTTRALAYAEQVHAGQRRSADGAPFIVHPVEVACLLHAAGAADRLVAAGVLHDIIEKPTLTPMICASASGHRSRRQS